MAYRIIVVGSNGSDASSAAVRTAAELAKACGSALVVLTAFIDREPGAADVFGLWQQGRPSTDTDRPPDDLEWATTPSAAADAICGAGLTLAQEVGVADSRAHVEAGDAADVIVNFSERESADLIVLGTGGVNELRWFLEGSVTNSVTFRSPCDVLVTPSP